MGGGGPLKPDSAQKIKNIPQNVAFRIAPIAPAVFPQKLCKNDIETTWLYFHKSGELIVFQITL